MLPEVDAIHSEHGDTSASREIPGNPAEVGDDAGFDLEARGKNRMASIGDDIRSQLISHPAFRKVTRIGAGETVKALFSLDWNPHQFFKEQEYGLPPEKVFDHVVCLTGTFQQAQAMTIAEFLEQTWPLTHQPLQALLKKALLPSLSSQYKRTLNTIASPHDVPR